MTFFSFSTKYLYLYCYSIIGDNMKKTFMMMIIAVVLGSIAGSVLFSNYKENNVYAFSNSKNLYFLQEGVYSSMDSVNRNTKDLNNKLVILDNDKYHVYVGITSNIKNAKKIKDVYKDMGYSIYQKEINVSNTEFLNNIEQFDILLDKANKSDLLTIEEVVLSNYDDLVVQK